MLYYVWKRHSVGADVVILAVLVGLYYGAVGIAVAHELMHRPSRLDRWLGDFLLCTVTYPHFSIEHVYGHHIRVATPDDPASARLGEPLYAFVPRSIIGGLRGAWEIETKRLKSRGQGVFSIHNRMLGYLAIVTAWYVGGLSAGRDLRRRRRRHPERRGHLLARDHQLHAALRPAAERALARALRTP